MISIYVPDALRKSVEGSSNNKITVLYDDYGYPSFMRIYYPQTWDNCYYYGTDVSGNYLDGITPQYNLSDVSSSGIFHRMFLKDATTMYNEVFVGLYPASVINGSAVSLPNKQPATNFREWEIQGLCKGKGKDWHTMNNWEYCFINQAAFKGGFGFYGNSQWGKSHNQPQYFAARTDGWQVSGQKSGNTDISGAYNGTTYTGGGPSAWCTQDVYNEPCDLIGNVYEYVQGIQIINGYKLYIDLYNAENSNAPTNDTGIRIVNYDAGGSPDANSPLSFVYCTPAQGSSENYVDHNTIADGDSTTRIHYPTANAIYNRGEMSYLQDNTYYSTLETTAMGSSSYRNHGIIVAKEAMVKSVKYYDPTDAPSGSVHLNLNPADADGGPNMVIAFRGGCWRSDGSEANHGVAGMHNLNMRFRTQDYPYATSGFQNTVGFRVCKYGSTKARTDI